MPVPDRFYTAADSHTDTYRRFEADVLDLLADLDTARPRLAGRLTRLAADIDTEAVRLTADTKVFLAAEVPAVWAAGAAEHPTDPPFSWTDTHRTAVELLAADLMANITAVALGMSRDVRELAGLLASDPDQAELAAQRLRAGGITAVTYDDGRRMRASTHVATVLAAGVTAAHNLGALNQHRTAGIALVAISDGPDCGLTEHDDPVLADGLVLTVEAAAAFPLAHPGCRRTFRPATGSTGPVWLPDTENDPAGFAQYLIATPAAPVATNPGARAERTARSARAGRSARTPRHPRGAR